MVGEGIVNRLFKFTHHRHQKLTPKLEIDIEIDLGEKNIDKFTDEIAYPNAIRQVENMGLLLLCHIR